MEIYQYICMKWALCFLLGLLVSLVGFFNNLGVENIAGKKFVITSNMMLYNRFISLSTIFPFYLLIRLVMLDTLINYHLFSCRHLSAFLVFTAFNLGLTLFASLFTALVSPAAAGSGIPEVKAYLNGVDAPDIFSLRTLVVKVRIFTRSEAWFVQYKYSLRLTIHFFIIWFVIVIWRECL